MSQQPTIGNDYEAVKATIGQFANLVKVGPYDAALVWADPLPLNGAEFRYYALYWSDGTYDFSLFAGQTTPEETLDTARSIYCS